MKNKILKYIEFIKEEMNDTPETYIKGKLMELKKAIDKLFDEESGEEPETISIDKAKGKGKEKKAAQSLSSQGVTLDSSEISLYSQTDDSLTVKYSDEEGVYNLFISINIKDGIPKDPNGDFSTDDITKLFVKFKKYGIDDIDLIGQTTHNVNVERENGEFKISLTKKTEEPGQPAQGAQNQQAPQEKPQEESEGEKMTLLEFLEYLKSDFDDKYGESKGLGIETE